VTRVDGDAFARHEPTSQLLWGSDYPYRPVGLTADGWDKYAVTADVRRAIDRDNALRLFPRLDRA
jgi:predicted TIM-barrel fold metal-dependent hydrolase